MTKPAAPKSLPAVDAYIANAAPFAQPILHHLRQVIHAAVPDVDEAIKWSMPFFVYKGIILANMAAHKAHCSFGVWKEDAQGLLKLNVAERDAGGGMGSFGRIASLDDLPSAKDLKALLSGAAAKIARGDRIKNWEGRAKRDRPAVEIPEALAAALRTHREAAAQFEAMTSSCQREYCEWIGEAKRAETVDRRVREALAMIAEGKGRYWKYQAAR